MLTQKQKECTKAGATALNAAARLLNEAVEELSTSPVISNHDWCVLANLAPRLCRKADVISSRAVRKNAFC
jgi:hypothetical protein